MVIAVVVSKCNYIVNYQSCSANIGINLRNSCPCTYSSGSSNKNTSSSSCRNSSNYKIPAVVVVNIFVCVAFELVE